MMTHPSTTALALCALLGAAGCLSLGPKADPTRFYVLGQTIQRADPPPAPDTTWPAIGLRAVRLADYLLTPLMVVRVGPHEINYADFDRWGEDLDRGINRTVAGYLSARAGIARVDVVPWPVRTRHDYLVDLHVHRFEGVAGRGEAHLLADWEIVDEASGRILARGRTDARRDGWAAGDFETLAALLDGALASLASDVAAALAGLP